MTASAGAGCFSSRSECAPIGTFVRRWIGVFAPPLPVQKLAPRVPRKMAHFCLTLGRQMARERAPEHAQTRANCGFRVLTGFDLMAQAPLLCRVV